MKPTLSTIKKDSTFSSTTNRSWTIWSKDGGCPFGTVPVKRMTKDDLIRLSRMPPPEDVTFNAEYDVSNNNSRPNGGYISSQGYKVVAIAQISYNPHNNFAGAGMVTILYNPQVNGQQHSGSRLKIHKGSDILQVGWRVDPTLYGDIKTRLFIHFQAGKIHCFNTLCPGFVQVNHDIPLDTPFMNISQRGGEQWGITVHIDRDLSGNWWLLMTPNFTRVGFWPQSLFTDLKSFATNVDWGGVVYSPPGVPEPPMGSSQFPIENTLYDAYCADVTIVNEKGKTIEVDSTITHTDYPYKVEFKELSHGAKDKYFVLYGGPGESTHV
uniref:Neprosin PEP catalytic domain-containing protein n=1 Tax=Solanum lycopersicum TaxID=4081 RepID=A0A3Q7HG85_SOLLC